MNGNMTMEQVLLLALGVKARFRCKNILRKPDAHSWSVEQDFLHGAESAMKMLGYTMHPIVEQCRVAKRSITTLIPSDFVAFELVTKPHQEGTPQPRGGIGTVFAGQRSGEGVEMPIIANAEAVA